MKNFDYFKGIKIWLLSILGFDTAMALYLFISGRVFKVEPVFSEVVSFIAGLILIASIAVGLMSIVYALKKKKKIYILHSLGILFLSFVLILEILILALASIY